MRRAFFIVNDPPYGTERAYNALRLEAIELLHCLGLALSQENRNVALALNQDLKDRCRREKIPDTTRPVSLLGISSWLKQGWVPLILVDARLVGEAEQPHWVAVTGLDSAGVIFNDPLGTAGSSTKHAPEFKRRLGFRGTSCAVIIKGRK